VTSIEALAEQWRSSGVERGETLLLHSNITRMLRTCRRNGWRATATDILDSFLAALGADGTLLVPLFNFDFTKGVPFDIRHTPSQMGALTEAARLRSDAVRTGHPVYSFAALGAEAQRFAKVDNASAYGTDSPFAILRELDGKVAALDLEDFDSMTIYHHVEELKQVPYRYFKDFSGEYTDAEGRTSVRGYRIFVRDIEHGVVTNVNPAGELLWAAGLYRGFRPGVETGLRTIKANEMFDFVAGIIDQGRALDTLYSVVPSA
jgi:aminoglycoside 3-N-acetyltransferase